MHHALALVLALSLSAPVTTTPSETPADALATAQQYPEPERPIEPTTRRLRVAGYVTLVLGCGLLGTMGAAAVVNAQTLARLDRRADDLAPGQRLAPFQRFVVQQDLASARVHRNVAIGTGVAAAVSLALATTLFVLVRQRERARPRLAIAPTWLPGGAGLTLQLRLP